MTAEDFELLIAAANKRLAVYREYRERLMGEKSPFFRSLFEQSESRIRGCELWLNELHGSRVNIRKRDVEDSSKPRSSLRAPQQTLAV